MNYINLNGKIVPKEDAGLTVDNKAFRYGYGLFETMLVQDGVIQLQQYHWERLFAGMNQLSFELSALMTPQFFEDETLRTVKKNRLEKLCRVRLQVYAGAGGLYDDENRKVGFVVECFPLEPEAIRFNENGLVVGIANGLNKSMDTLSNLKSTNALIYAMAAQQARENKWNDALVCNTTGNIIESTIANIFWIKNETVYTPPLSDGCIAGVIRRHVLEKIAVIEKTLTPGNLAGADEIFFTNAIKRIKWVASVGNRQMHCVMSKNIYQRCFS